MTSSSQDLKGHISRLTAVSPYSCNDPVVIKEENFSLC